MRQCQLQQHGWTQRLSYRVKQVREGEPSRNIPYMWNLKGNYINEITKQRLTDLENELRVAGRKR